MTRIYLTPGPLFPGPHVDFPQALPPQKGQALGQINSAGGGTGAVEVA